MNAFAHFFAIIAHERALVKSRGALFADFRFFEKFAEKGLTNGDDGCIMRLVKGNGVFERWAQRRDFLYLTSPYFGRQRRLSCANVKGAAVRFSEEEKQ